MNLKEYIFNRNYQHSKNAPIYNFNLSILVAIDCLNQIPPSNYRILQQNGLEVIFLLAKTENAIFTIPIKNLPIGNWIIISHEKNLQTNFLLKELKTEITKDYVLLVNNLTHLNTFTIENLTTLSSAITQYDAHFISQTNNGNEALLFSPKSINNILNFTLDTYDLNNNSIRIVKRALELSGLREISIPSNNRSENINKYYIRHLYNKSDDEIISGLQDSQYQYYNYKAKTTINYPNTKNQINKIYDYRDKEQTFAQLLSYLNEFDTYKLLDSQFYKKKFQKIVLVQSHNEANNVTNFLNNIGLFFDGIIMLDDESSDETYEMASHEKLLLKVRKKRKEFLDLENRNILLILSSFFSVEWLCFMDFDERINPQFADFSFLNNKQIDTVTFNIIHLWDHPQLFNASFPGTYKGIEKVFRMFRNIGYSQIKSNKKFHFAATPYFGKQFFDSGILIMHYAFLDERNRKQKYDFYTKNDPLATPHQYDFLINNCHSLKEVGVLSKEDLSNIEYNNYLIR